MPTTGHLISLPLRPAPRCSGATAASAIDLTSDDEATGATPQPVAASFVVQLRNTAARTSGAPDPQTLRMSARLMGKAAATPAADGGILDMSPRSVDSYLAQRDQLNYQPKRRQAKGNKVVAERSEVRVVDDGVQVSDAGPQLTVSDTYRCEQAMMQLDPTGHNTGHIEQQLAPAVQQASLPNQQANLGTPVTHHDPFKGQSDFVSLQSGPSFSRKQLKAARRLQAQLKSTQRHAKQLKSKPGNKKGLEKTQQRLKQLLQKQPRAPSTEIQILHGHKQFSFWKDKYFRELGIAREFELIANAILEFQESTITTVVPNRYMRMSSTVIKVPEGVGFPGSIEILTPGKAIEQAYREHTAAKNDITRLVLWTDGSARENRRGSHRGFAVTWRRSTDSGWDDWEIAGYKAIGELLDSAGMEALAVIKAFDKALEIVRQSPGQLKAVAIYSDAVSALNCAKASGMTPIGQHMTKKARQLRQLGAEVSLHWCPGHSKVPGNELADIIAYRASAHKYDGMAEVIDLSDDE